MYFILDLSGVFAFCVRFSVICVISLLIKLVEQGVVVTVTVAHDFGLLIDVVVLLELGVIETVRIIAEIALLLNGIIRWLLSFYVVIGRRSWRRIMHRLLDCIIFIKFIEEYSYSLHIQITKNQRLVRVL